MEACYYWIIWFLIEGKRKDYKYIIYYQIKTYRGYKSKAKLIHLNHRNCSLPNMSKKIRWSLDLRWQRPDHSAGFYGLYGSPAFPDFQRSRSHDRLDGVWRGWPLVQTEGLGQGFTGCTSGKILNSFGIRPMKHLKIKLKSFIIS